MPTLFPEGHFHYPHLPRFGFHFYFCLLWGAGRVQRPDNMAAAGVRHLPRIPALTVTIVTASYGWGTQCREKLNIFSKIAQPVSFGADLPTLGDGSSVGATLRCTV